MCSWVWIDVLEAEPGDLSLSGKGDLLIVTGKAQKLLVEGENRLPRAIEGWPWYAQQVFGAFVALLTSLLIGRHTAGHRSR